MRRLTCHCLALLIAVFCGVSLGLAQTSDFQDLHPNAKSGIVPTTTPTAPTATSDGGDKSEKAPPTLAIAAAVLCAVVVLSVICVPTRKSESMTVR